MTLRQLAAYAAATALALGFAACEPEDNVPPIGGDADPLAALVTGDLDATIDQLAVDEPTLAAALAPFAAEASPRFSGDCFTLVYPVGVAFPDGTTASADDAEGIRAAIRAWIDANPTRPNRANRPRLVYPLDVQLADGTIATVDDRAAMRAQLQACRPEVDRCFTLQFPVAYDFAGTTESFDDAAALREALRDYRRANPDAARPTLVYPVTVEYRDGTLVSLADAADLERLRATCRADAGGGDSTAACYRLVYPITLTHRRGQTFVAETPAQLRRAFSHANERGRWSIQFPIEAVVGDTTLTLADAEAFGELRRSCVTVAGGGPDDCLRYDFPLTFRSRRMFVEVNNRAQLARALAARDLALVFPFTVTTRDGARVEVTDFPTYRGLLADCR